MVSYTDHNASKSSMALLDITFQYSHHGNKSSHGQINPLEDRTNHSASYIFRLPPGSLTGNIVFLSLFVAEK